MNSKPTQDEVLQALKVACAGLPVSIEMMGVIGEALKVVEGRAQELRDGAEYSDALVLINEYELLLSKLSALSDGSLTKIRREFPHVGRAVEGKRVRDRTMEQRINWQGEMEARAFGSCLAPDRHQVHSARNAIESIRLKSAPET